MNDPSTRRTFLRAAVVGAGVTLVVSTGAHAADESGGSPDGSISGGIATRIDSETAVTPGSGAADAVSE